MRALGLCLFALLTTLIAPAAQAQDAPTYHRVTGVAQNDTLSVRRGPFADAEKIGELKPDTNPVEVTALNEGATWGRIPYFGEDGWVSMTYLVPVEIPMLPELPNSTHQTGVPIGLFCGGTEPFWHIKIDDADQLSADFATGEGTLTLRIKQAMTAVAHIDLPAGIEASDEQGNTILATIQAGMCSDGMSDMTYGMTVSAWRHEAGNSALFAGCCRLQPSDQ